LFLIAPDEEESVRFRFEKLIAAVAGDELNDGPHVT